MQDDQNRTGGHRSRDRLLLILATLVLADVLSTFESSMVFAALKAVIAQTKVRSTRAGWSAPTFWLEDQRRSSADGSATYMAASACSWSWWESFWRDRYCLPLARASAGSSPARALQGVSTAIMPLCFGLLRQMVPPKRLHLNVGILLSANSIGLMSGLVVGGLIVDRFPWQDIFFASGAAAALVLLAVALLIPTSTAGVRRSLDWIGVLLYAPGLVALLYGISSFGSPIYTAWGVWSIVGGILLLATWIAHERGHPSPLVDIKAFTDRGNTAWLLRDFPRCARPNADSTAFRAHAAATGLDWRRLRCLGDGGQPFQSAVKSPDRNIRAIGWLSRRPSRCPLCRAPWNRVRCDQLERPGCVS